MQTKTFLLWLTLGPIALGCAKQKFQIGKGDPDDEIKKCTKLAEKKLHEEAIECLEIFKSRFASTTQAQDAALRIADAYFSRKEYLMAADAYTHFIKLYPLNPKIDYAYYRAGFSYFKEAPKAIDRDQQSLVKAKDHLEQALRYAGQGPYEAPTREALLLVNERLARRVFYIGRFYFRTGEYKAAIPRFVEISEYYPEFPETARALYLLTRSHLKLGELTPARETLETMIAKYPKNPWTKKARKDYSDGARG